VQQEYPVAGGVGEGVELGALILDTSWTLAQNSVACGARNIRLVAQ
jgi:hypothetical protein